MNQRRAAALFRRLADLDAERAERHRQLAVALAETEEPEQPRRARPAPPVVDVDDMTRERARRMLRRSGVAT